MKRTQKKAAKQTPTTEHDCGCVTCETRGVQIMALEAYRVGADHLLAALRVRVERLERKCGQ